MLYSALYVRQTWRDERAQAPSRPSSWISAVLARILPLFGSVLFGSALKEGRAVVIAEAKNEECQGAFEFAPGGSRAADPAETSFSAVQHLCLPGTLQTTQLQAHNELGMMLARGADIRFGKSSLSWHRIAASRSAIEQGVH